MRRTIIQRCAPGLLAALAFAGAAVAEPFPADRMDGLWKMSKTYSVETSTGAIGLGAVMEGRIAATLAFLGDGKCRMTASQTTAGQMVTPMPFTYKYAYDNGALTLTEAIGLEPGAAEMDSLVPCLNASRFELVKIDDDTFEMRYADLEALGNVHSEIVGKGKCEYLADGRLKTVRKSNLGVEMTTTELHPPMVFRRVTGLTPESSMREDSPIFKILSCKRDDGDGGAYAFELEILEKDGNKLRLYRNIQRELRVALYEDAARTFDGDPNTLFVEFTELKLDGDRISGRAAVLPMSVTTLRYDPNTRKGTIAVSLKANQFDVARRYVRKNIEALARNSNIALAAGERPPPGRFYIGREEVVGGNILEMDFRTE